MSESKGPYRVVAYPVNHIRAFHVKDGPEVILSFGSEREAEDAKDRLNAAYAAGAASRDAEIERLRAEVYHTAPGELEFGGEGWTWKQQARANEDRLRELEAEVARLGGVVAAAVQAEQVARERVSVLEDACRRAADIDGSPVGDMLRAALNPTPPASKKEQA